MLHSLLLLGVLFGLLACQSVPVDDDMDLQPGLDYAMAPSSVEIDDWLLEGGLLDVRRGSANKTVLVAVAQNGARLATLAPPSETRVRTVANADTIQYNAFTRRFELVGDPVIQQGPLVVHQSYGSNSRIFLLEDGSIVEPGKQLVNQAFDD